MLIGSTMVAPRAELEASFAATAPDSRAGQGKETSTVPIALTQARLANRQTICAYVPTTLGRSGTRDTDGDSTQTINK